MTKTYQQTRSAVDPEAYVRRLEAAFAPLENIDLTATVVEILPGATKKGWKRFIIEITRTDRVAK